MTSVPFGLSTHIRAVAQEPQVNVINRYFEKDPTNQVEGVALLSRPGLRKFLSSVGDGPIRAMFHQLGAFSDQLFVVSGTELWKVPIVDPLTTSYAAAQITGSVSGKGFVSMVCTDTYMFMADGFTLQLYTDNGFAQGTLTRSGTITSGDQIKIDGTYYQWTSGSVDTGTPAGSSGAPWLVAMGSSDTTALSNMLEAINATGTAGTTYSTALTAHATVTAITSSATVLTVRAIDGGTAGNSISTTVPAGTSVAWGAATLAGGGAESLTVIKTPDDIGIVSLGYYNGYVLCVAANSQRFYWIQPGATTIDALDFAEAERSTDWLAEVKVIGDNAWFFGYGTTEKWYATGDGNAPFAPIEGVIFDIGIIQGTAVNITGSGGDQVIVVGSNGIVYSVRDVPVPISDPGTAERIRTALQALGSQGADG